MSENTSLGSVPAHAQKTIEDLQSQIAARDQENLKSKRAINAILESYNLPKVYPEEAEAAGIVAPIRRGQYYGQALATAVRDILTRRHVAAHGADPATINEIYDALSAGGYLFDTDDAENAKRGLRKSLGKNTAVFHKLPTPHWGLTEWYPNVKTSSKTKIEEKNGSKNQKESQDFNFNRKEQEAEMEPSETTS